MRCAGALLRVLQQDPDLAGFSHVVVDEAQQRTCLQDVGLAALRCGAKRAGRGLAESRSVAFLSMVMSSCSLLS